MSETNATNQPLYRFAPRIPYGEWENRQSHRHGKAHSTGSGPICWPCPDRPVRFLAIAILTVCAGCLPPNPQEVVVYTALDREFSEPIFAEFTEATGIRVLPKFDTESTKTVGLYNAIAAEANRPRCDVFWNNEILNTLRLEQAGRLTAYRSPESAAFPSMYFDKQGMWHGFAARARVLIVNTELLRASERPTSILQLADPQWKGKVGLAKPFFGTTASHAAVLFQHLGPDRAQEFFRAVAENAQVLAGNKRVAIAVARGQLAWGVTDTDDAMIELEKGMPVTLVYPDQADHEMGTLFIPNCVAIIQGSPQRRSAEKLIDFLLSDRVEALLAAGPSAQIPLRTDSTAALRVESPQSVKAMDVDFSAAAKQWNAAAEFLTEVFAK